MSLEVGLTCAQLIVDEQTPYQRVKIYESLGFGKVLTLDGETQVAFEW